MPLPDQPETEPQSPKSKRHNDRRCVATGAPLAPGDAAIRFARAPDGTLTADVAEKLPGRGAWLTSSRAALLQALEKGAFARALRAQVTLPDDQSPEAYADAVGALFEARALAALGLARRAGAVVSGFEKVKAALTGGSAQAYLHAAEAGADGVQKLSRLNAAQAQPVPVIGLFAGAALDQALGGTNMTHLALTDPRQAANLLDLCEKRAGFLPPEP